MRLSSNSVVLLGLSGAARGLRQFAVALEPPSLVLNRPGTTHLGDA